ncbi:MAG: peptidylprolyl isomerase [Tissierellia bacterium]|nr:peptidylprolyl isomerase [Tissierellia bacterium]
MLEQFKKPQINEEIAVLETSLGTIRLRLFPEVAPKAVENFKTHIKNGYYDGLIFHRVIPDFMIQGGDPQGTGRGGESIWGHPFEDEFHRDYRNFLGALSMANAGPGTNGSQFFIVEGAPVSKMLLGQMKVLGEKRGYPQEVIDHYKDLGGAPWLDGKHTVFGQVFEGMEVVHEIARVDRDGMDKPLEDVLIKEAKILSYQE